MGLSDQAEALAKWAREHRVWLARTGAVAGGVLLGGLILWSSDVHELWSAREKPKPPPAVSLPAVVPAPPSVKNLQRDTTQGRLGTDSSVSKVPLRLHLVQTIPGRDVHSGQAFLGVDRDHPQTYMGGAILENGAKVDEIYADHVVLLRGLHRTTLYVERPGTVAPEEGDALEMVGGSSPPALVDTTAHVAGEPVTDYLRAAPVYRNDVIVGFQIYPGKQSATFSHWGLQAGDVVTAVDGQPADDPDQLMQALQGLVDGQVLTATVLRNGEPVSVKLDGTAIPQRTASADAAHEGPD